MHDDEDEDNDDDDGDVDPSFGILGSQQTVIWLIYDWLIEKRCSFQFSSNSKSAIGTPSKGNNAQSFFMVLNGVT